MPFQPTHSNPHLSDLVVKTGKTRPASIDHKSTKNTDPMTTSPETRSIMLLDPAPAAPLLAPLWPFLPDAEAEAAAAVAAT